MAIVGTGKDAMEFGETPFGRRKAAAYAAELASRVVAEEPEPEPKPKKKAAKKKSSKKKGAK